jgi:tRNA A-37 threonylcarbamoyl transferase component Bud32
MSQPVRLTPFGSYLLVDRITSGGMADVYRARVLGIRGFSRTVAIKRIHPHLLERKRFMRMFIDEAKIAARLHHPNIVQIIELGEIGRSPYIVMEYIAGRDLFQLLRRLADIGEACPWPTAVRVAHDLALALHHAHEFVTPDERPQEIVHRDVSPRNVLLGYDGTVKLTDFGVARARDREEQTEHGVIKGKVRYMSPETAMGKTVDRRADVFSLGVVFAEMLTMARLRSGANDMAILLAIRDGALDTRRFEGLPTELRAVLEKALARNPEDRFQSAEDFRQALLASAIGPLAPMDREDLGHMVRGLFSREYEAERARDAEVDTAIAAGAGRRLGPASGTPDPEDEGRAPDLSADLATKSLPRLLFDLANGRCTGRLTLTRKPVIKTVFLKDGNPVFVASNVEKELFGEYLVARGAIQRRQLQQALDLAAGEGIRLMEAITRLQMVAPHQLFALLADQVRDRLLELFSWPDGAVVFHDGLEPADVGLPLNIDTVALVHEGVRDHVPLGVIRRRLQPDLKRQVQRTSAPIPPGITFSGREQKLMRRLDEGPVSVAELARFDGAEENALRLAYLLVEGGLAEQCPPRT